MVDINITVSITTLYVDVLNTQLKTVQIKREQIRWNYMLIQKMLNIDSDRLKVK